MHSHRVRLEGKPLSAPLTIRVKAATRTEAVDQAISLLAGLIRADLIGRKDARSAVIKATIGSHAWSVSMRYDYDSPQGIWRSIDSVEELANPLFTPLYTWTTPDITGEGRRIKHGNRVRPHRGKWTM